MELLQFTCLLLLISVRCLTGFGQQCGGNQWQCDDGACLPLSWYCDGNGDCMDGSDEMACPCPRGQVACMTGAPGCVSTSAVCDGQRQCSDGSDEFNCPENQGCLQGDWRCRNKICIPKDQYCNGANDCVDNSDETCGRCGPMAVRCPGGACLTEDERCDGKLHCSDGSDEPSTCGRTCSEENGGCSHSCLDQPWGALCSCPKGHRLSAHGASCLDVDECSLPYGPCMHFCVNTPGSFYCHCRDGFQLQGTTYCYAKGNYTKFLTAKKGTIGFLNLKTLRFESIQSIAYDPLALAFDLSRSSFYWADDQGNIYKAKEQKSRILYHGQYGVRSLVCDWLTGQLYWTNQKTRSIHVGAADGSGFATVLAKNIDPLELVLLPIESLLFWSNKGPGDKMTLERSGMDGLKQESLVVLTAQAPRSLTLDVTVRRLYWMSDFKKSIETVRVDGSGRYSFLEFFKRRPAQSLAVFERWFYWTDQMGLWRSPQDRPDQKTFIQRTTLSVLEAYHEQQQPKAPSACVKSGCLLCMPTLDLPAGFTCTCPDDKLLMADGSCEYPRFAYATSTTLNLLELKGKELIKTLLLTTDDVMESFDIDWRGDWVYWANSTGDVMRRSLNTDQTETVPTLRPACVVSVDQKMRNLYWLSCDEVYVGVTNMDQGYPRRLYQSGSEVRDVYLDWQRGRLYLLEAGWILSMRLPGGNPRKVLRVEGHVAGRIVLDLKSNTLLWNTEGDDLKIMSLLKSQTHLAGREWNVPGSIMAAHAPLLVSLFNDVITVWDRRDRRRVHDVPVGPGVVRVIVALDVKEDSNKALPPVLPTLAQTCTSPSVMCRGSTLCISQTQLCDTLRDCPDGFDEESCITKCPNRGEFRCKDRRKCIERRLVCDGRAHCQDGSDEVGCQTIAAPTSQTAPLKCRMGSRLCKDGRECVLHSHVCDGEVDCKDGSDEQNCGGTPIPLTTAYLAPTTTIPVCTSPSVMCRGSTLCISQTQLCDTLRDCPDGFDEESCITKCPNRGEFRCKDRRKCIERRLVCDGRAQCHDGSDEIGCPTMAAPTSQTAPLKCRMGSRLCKDGRECVLHSHVCDGEVDCKDGSDEQNCELLCKAGQFQCAHGKKCIDQQQVCDGKAQCQDRSDEMDCFKPTKSCSHRCDNNSRCIPETFLCDRERDCADGSDEEGCDSNKALPPVLPTLAQTCTSPSVMCRGSTLCISQTQLCDTLRDCPDGFDEESCITKCPNRGEFRCKDRRKCIERSLVCDGRAHCHDGSDEIGCPTMAAPTSQTAPLKCRMGSRLCKDGRECVLHSHVCDGEVDCKDGSDEQNCGGTPIPLTTAYLAPTTTIPVCTSPSVMCRGSTLCISQTQLCDTLRDCPDGFDEESCITKCPNRGEFRCKDRRKCIERRLVCDGRAQCHDGSDEIGCPTMAAPTSQTAPLKCRMGSRLCKDGRECVLHSHVCDGEVDCKDGSDEQNCELLCKAGQFQCAHGKKCIDQQQVCDGKAQCQDRSDEMDCFKPTKSCSHRCDNNSRCIPETFLCDRERDCADGSDEEGCDSNKALPPVLPTLAQTCTSPSVMCRGSTLCISQTQLCDTLRDCPDGFDEESCITKCPNRGEFRCKDRRKCIERSLVCDGRAHCHDGSDEIGCPTMAAPTSQTAPLKCRMGSRLCKDGRECVLHSHVCDGEVDCKDGSDEQNCGGTPIPLTTAYLAPTTTIPVCTSPSVMCRGSTLCISQTQLCDTLRDCPDGFDVESCITKCPNRGEFRCKDRRKCIERRLVCDGRAQCHDGSDEIGCPTMAAPTSQTAPLKCRMGSRLCKDGRECVLHSHVCDGEVDCKDGSDEQNCELLCKAGQFQCAHGKKCIDQQQVCDGKAQCQDRSDEMDCFKPTKSCSHRCDNNSRCIPETFLCDRERDCADGSDEEGCDSNKALPPVLPTLAQTCTSPSVMCRGSTLCISQTQLCDTLRDCPDGFDEESCITKCPNRGEFRCKDRRKCIERRLVCDGRAHCQDGSDEVGCQTIAAPTSQTAPLKCRMGSRLCKDGRECVLHSHVCDGEVDCKDGSDEQNCGGTPIPLTTAYLAPTTTIPVCTSPSVMCRGSTLCISQTQLCDTLRDCPDGFDEESCITKCPNRGEFRCKDRRKCIERRLVCDGRAQCHDGSDEIGCPTMAAPTSQTAPLKCRMGSRLCKDGRECVLHSHVCDGEVDCKDGSDEQNCELLCKAGQFQCAHGKKCIDQQQVCDGKAQCQDRSDEMDCFKPTKSCSHRCDNNSRCIPETFLCDRERDCADGSDEEGCDSNKALPPVLPTLAQTCTSPSVMCRGSTLCISQTQLCDTLRDCPDGFDEESCITKCPNRGEFRCKDRRKCIERRLVCDGRAQCHDGSDEIGCPTMAAPTSQTAPLKCRMGSRLCKDGRECVLHSHVCDGEVDCKDGSDEQDCELLCKAGQFQCAHGKKCIDQQQVCDGNAQCQDRSDEMNCFKPTKSCSHRCDNNSRCIPETFICDGERDCVDGSDEEDCVAKPCGQQHYRCINGQCVSEALRCDGHADCGDHSDEAGCAKPPHCPPERRCPNSHECLVEEWLCDGEQDCQDGSDERDCKVSPVTCGEFQWSCVSRSQCIPATWRCDGQKDCEDYSDEAGCGQVKCSNQLYQCGSGECVDHSLLCDHIINCPDGSDEGQGCSTNNCSSPGTPQCDQHCVSTPYGPRCICAAGFRLQANGLSCVDVDECNEVLPPVCSHTCLNTRSSFLCRCHHGYLLEPNGRSCKTQDEAHLLASVQYELLVLGLHSSSLSVLSTSQTPVFCVDYDWRDQRVYWVSLEEESIKWTSINTKDTGTLVKGVKSDSIAVDWVGRNLYWLDGLAGQILAVRLGTSTVKSQNYIVVLDEDLEQPRSLLLLPHKGLMYWSEVGSDPQIERSGMDGSERKVVLTRGLSWPVSLSVDTLTDRIYWADEKLQCIGSVSLEGHNVRLLQLTEMPSPFSVMVFNDMVYWSDTKRRTIQVSHKNTGKNRKVLLKRPGQPFGIRMMHPLQQTNVSSPCEKLQCSHICLLAPGLSSGPRAGSTGPKAVCRCAAGLLLAGDGLTCSTLVDTTFLLLLSPTAVTQIYLSTIHNGVGLKRLPEHHIWSLPGMHQASGLDFAVRERKLYLADAAQGSVDLLKLSSSGLTPGSRVLNLQDDTVMALAVDWVTLNLYWSSRKQPDLHVTTTKGQHTAPLLQLGLQGTTSIALHPPSGRLCFTALGQVDVRSLPQVYCAFMDGRSQKLLWRKAVMPTSLLFSNKGTQLYWADIGAGVIDSILLDGSGYKQFKADPGLMSFTLAENVLLWSSLDKDVTRLWFSDGFQPKQLWFEVNTNVVALRVYSKTSQKGTNSCSARNGGCSQLCLAYPGGRSCRCGRGYQPIDTKTCSPFPSLQCPEGSRACSDGSRCLPLSKFCNHQTDCLDHSDEIKCGSGVKPQDVSNSKPSRGHAGNTVPPGQDWSGSTTPGGVEVQKLDSESCDVQQCNGHGKCVTRGGETTCQCVLGYQGVFCEEGEGPGVSNAPLTLGILSLIGGVLIAAVIIRKRARAAARGQSTEKETLMTDMDEGTVYAVSFNNDLYDPDQELNSSADGTSQHL
ncbi:uncharacterized protein ACWYII_044611 isoform 3-T3 [Salvelinus alpinus]